MPHLHVSYDPAAGATYVSVEDGKVVRTVALGDLVNVDLDDSGTVTGIEFLALPTGITQAMVDRVVERFPELSGLERLERWALQPAHRSAHLV